MLTIEINNSYSKISGLSTLQEKELKELLSYDVGTQAAFYAGGHRPRRKSLLGRRGEFPTGLLPRVNAAFPRSSLRDLRHVPVPIGRTPNVYPFEPYQAQVDAAQAAADKHRGCISMPTGTGKSLVIAMIADKLDVKTLVIVPSVEIKKQLKASIDTLCVGHNVTVENIDSKALQTAKDYDCLIIDEAHHVAAKTYQKLNKTAWVDIYYRFFLTATPFRNNTEETLLFEALAGQVIYALSYKDAVKAGYIVPVEAYYIETPNITTDAYTWSQVYSQLVVSNQTKNEAIASTLVRLNAVGASTLCLVKEVAHGDKLSAMTGLNFANGKDNDTRQFIEQFNAGKIKSLIGTTGILGEGVDTKPCEYVIIAALGKAKSAFLQQVGRAVRTYPGKESAKVIIIKDKSHKFTLRHFNEQKKILKDYYGIVPEKLDI